MDNEFFQTWEPEDFRARAQVRATQKTKARADHEHNEQAALIGWAWSADTLDRWPDLAYLHAIPNGGHRHPSVAVYLQAEGVQAGVPDLCLPVARGEYHGLYLEMKHGKNKPTENQERWLGFLELQGYSVTVCWGAEEAKEVIREYMDLK